VTAGAQSPYLKAGIGYVRFIESADWSDRTLSLKRATGETYPCEIVELPFYDREKRIPRGIDKAIP
jgi:glycine cleavage system aminomethyltransferase T